MGVIFIPKHLIRQRQKCVHINSQMMNLPKWKYVLRCCAKCSCVNITDQETDDQYSNKTPSIRFLIYHTISRCTANGRIMLNDIKICCMCKHDSTSEQSTNI